MTKEFSQYTATIRRMLKGTNEELSQFFTDTNIDENWVAHDNWNNGIDFYDIIIRIPIELYEKLRKNNTFDITEKNIYDFYKAAMRGDGESIQIRDVILKPTIDTIYLAGENIDDTMWKPGYFRLFISHLSKDKLSASNLKQCLKNYGIDCFVAHEDIVPSKEWEIEIEKALFTMDALCAIVVPEFVNSKWCDQEVGIALGQRKAVISIDKGSLPYGFFGKYQALKSKNKNANTMAYEIWKIISTNDYTKNIFFTKFVALLLNATNEQDALQYIDVIKQCESVGKQYIENLYDNISSNNILNTKDILRALNPLFKKYGLKSIERVPNFTQENSNKDLPF